MLLPKFAMLAFLRDNNMKKQKIWETIVLAAIVVTVVTIASTIALLPRLRDVETISSGEVDRTLYVRLDKYNRAIREIPGVAGIVVTAENNPDELSEEDRRVYLDYQRQFFDGWETAWTYNNAGHLDADRWNIWNTWFANEVRRRPQFGWVENRKFYSGDFLVLVDDSVFIQQ